MSRDVNIEQKYKPESPRHGPIWSPPAQKVLNDEILAIE